MFGEFSPYADILVPVPDERVEVIIDLGKHLEFLKINLDILWKNISSQSCEQGSMEIIISLHTEEQVLKVMCANEDKQQLLKSENDVIIPES